MSEGNDEKWEMPKAVFRSSTGSLPKSFEDTISQAFSAGTYMHEIDEDDDILGVMTPPSAPTAVAIDDGADRSGPTSQNAAENVVRAKAAAPTAERIGMSTGIIVLVIALVAAAIAALYYVLNRAPGDATFQ